ncbi:hypothetical protein KCV00_g184, partial [Aureobasidium melanogenum]
MTCRREQTHSRYRKQLPSGSQVDSEESFLKHTLGAMYNVGFIVCRQRLCRLMGTSCRVDMQSIGSLLKIGSSGLVYLNLFMRLSACFNPTSWVFCGAFFLGQDPTSKSACHIRIITFALPKHLSFTIMRPSLIRRWIDNLFPTRDDSTTNTTTDSSPKRTIASIIKTKDSSSISSLWLPPPCNIRYHEELSNSSSSPKRHLRSTSNHVQYRNEPPLFVDKAHTSTDEADNLKVETQNFDPMNEAESTRWTVDDAATPSQLNLRLHNYELCNLLWLRPDLEGKKAVGASHPFHHTHYDAAGAVTRSLVAFIAAFSLDEGHQYFKPVGTGVFFNKHSISNISDSFNMTYRLESSRSGARGLVPHLAAARSALQSVRTTIVPDRIQALRSAALHYGWSEIDVQAVARFQLIVATDSQALLDEISSWKSSKQLRRSLDVGEPGERDILVDLLDQIEALSKLGIQVTWSRVSERWNRPARKLAADAIIGHCVRLEGRKPSRITDLYC